MNYYAPCSCGRTVQVAPGEKTGCGCGNVLETRSNGDVGYSVVVRPATQPRPAYIVKDGKLRKA